MQHAVLPMPPIHFPSRPCIHAMYGQMNVEEERFPSSFHNCWAFAQFYPKTCGWHRHAFSPELVIIEPCIRHQLSDTHGSCNSHQHMNALRALERLRDFAQCQRESNLLSSDFLRISEKLPVPAPHTSLPPLPLVDGLGRPSLNLHHSAHRPRCPIAPCTVTRRAKCFTKAKRP